MSSYSFDDDCVLYLYWCPPLLKVLKPSLAASLVGGGGQPQETAGPQTNQIPPFSTCTHASYVYIS